MHKTKNINIIIFKVYMHQAISTSNCNFQTTNRITVMSGSAAQIVTIMNQNNLHIQKPLFNSGTTVRQYLDLELVA